MLYDTIRLEKITYNHENPTPSQYKERNKNLNLEISRGREEQSLLVLFKHNERSVVA